MAVEGLDPAEELLVVPERDEHLGVVADRLLEDRERALRDLVLVELPDLVLRELGARGREELAGRRGKRDDVREGEKRERKRPSTDDMAAAAAAAGGL